MDVTTLFGVLNIAATLAAGLLLWWGLSAKFDELEDYVAAHCGDLPNRADRMKDRVVAERVAASRRIEDLKVHLSHRHHAQTARLDKVSTRVAGLTTRVDGLARTVARIEGRLKMDRADRRIPNSLRRRSRIGRHRCTRD